MTVECEGIPYADTFAVEVRWVARRQGGRDIMVEVGVVVDFKKSTFLKNKIRDGTIEETVPVHKDLFEAIKAACDAASGDEAPDDDTELVEEAIDVVDTKGANVDEYTIAVACGALVLLVFVWRLYAWSSWGGSDDSASELHSVDMNALAAKIDKMEAEIKAVQGTLDAILALLKADNN